MDATNDSGKANASGADDKSVEPPDAELPQVDSPSLAPDESEAAKPSTAKPGAVDGHKVSTAVAIYKAKRAGEPDLDPKSSLFSRLRAKAQLPPLAAAIVLTLGTGVLAGSLGMVGVNQLFDTAHNEPTREAALKETLAQLGAEIDVLKAAQAAAAKAANAQMSRLSERLDKAEREPAAKVAKLSESISQLERRIVASSNSAPATQPAAPAPSTSVQPGNQGDITGTIPTPRPSPAKDISRLPVIQGWVLQRVVDGTAIIYSRDGMIEVGVGHALPGGGRVEDIRRYDGRWIVVTSRGLVTTR